MAGAGCSEESINRPYDVESYALTGEFDWESQRLRATVAISLTLNEDSPRLLELDSDVAVSAVRLVGVGPATFHSLADPGRIVVLLDKSIEAGDRLALEIDYEAAASEALRAVPPREGDPLPIRALYTDSEPLGAPAWMPCNNRPADRARFSVSMRMDAAEMMISNGVLAEDVEEPGGGRRVRYETGYSLPTYLMAFAISDFEVKAADDGGVPIAIWHRRGLPGSHDAMVMELGRVMDIFEGLLGPYPFERYSLVLLPGFPGGMENAGASFQRETVSTEPGLAADLTLAAHELAHQWIGDLVTVETWDDLWIKEGMATLLEYEAARAHIDASGAGSLNGDELWPEDGVPIRDQGAPPLLKYTSGPYSRGAWLLTQIRSLIGDEAFFAALRGVLERKRFGSIGTDEFLDAFGPALGPEALERARRAVDARVMPQIYISKLADEPLRVTLTDPDGALVAPMDLAWIKGSGEPQTVSLTPGSPASLEPGPEDPLLVLDPADRHPDWEAFPFDTTTPSHYVLEAYGLEAVYSVDVYNDKVRALRAPQTSEQFEAFLGLPGPHQRAVLQDFYVVDTSSPAAFSAFEGALNADAAKLYSLDAACSEAMAAAEDPVLHEAWTALLAPIVSAPQHPFGLAYLQGFAACSDLGAALGLFDADLAAIEGGFTVDEVSELRLTYLAKFNLDIPWYDVAKSGPTLRSRAIAIERLARSATALPEWRETFIELVSSIEASELLPWAIHGLVRSTPGSQPGDAESMAAVRGVLFKEVTRSAHRSALCGAYSLARYYVFPDDPNPLDDEVPEVEWVVDPAWDQLVRDLASAPLSEQMREYLANPTLCL